MKFNNEKEIKQCILLLKMGKKLDVDPTEHIDRVIKIMNGEITTRERLRGN